jgi:hypothetical protein
MSLTVIVAVSSEIHKKKYGKAPYGQNIQFLSVKPGGTNQWGSKGLYKFV